MRERIIAGPPEEIRVLSDGGGLTLLWADRDSVSLSAATLRRACRCAWCTRDRVLASFEVDDRQAITDLRVLGSHGLNLTFADGHARGVFPWAYLHDLATDASVADAPVAHGRLEASAATRIANRMETVR